MWHNDRFYYTTGMLKGIASNYDYLYLDASWNTLFSVAESKADFDMALSSIGKGYWRGLDNHKFGYYKYFGRLQQVVIAAIMGIPDRKLEGMGFKDARIMRSVAFQRMRDVLNKGKLR